MKKIPELKFGFRDAENYRNKDFKELFNKIFVRTEELDSLCKSNVFFLLGEKGTGKTAFAMYFSNNDYKNTSGSIHYIRETEYEKFITLKKERHLTLSDYTSIWKVILYLLMSGKISQQEPDVLLSKISSKFKGIKQAMDEYYVSAFSPEIIYAIDFVEKSKLAAEILAKYAKLNAGESSEVSFSETRFQTNLLYIKRQFENALNSVKLTKNHLIFIDGIDIRPRHVPYEDYLECIKGLSNAVWEINNDFFTTIKDSPGRMRIVLLMRPDIFSTLGLQNMNNKFRDNSVLLDWRTTYPTYRNSEIFNMVDRLLSSQQISALSPGVAWDYYFPFRIYYERETKWQDHSFVEFLRNSLFRPRDIIAMLEILQTEFIKKRKNPLDVFDYEDLQNNEFKRKYSDFRLGEIKDHLSFYYSEKDYELFLRFFTYLKGEFEFTYKKFNSAYNLFIKYIIRNKFVKPVFCESEDTFLQFLYETNVICYIEYIENETLIRWCFRERDYSNVSPKVRIGVTYRIHYGLSKALNIGKEILYEDYEPSIKGKENNDIYIVNLDFSAKPNDLRKLFENYGKVKKVTIPKDSKTKKRKGYGFVAMEKDEDAEAAISALNKTKFMNRIITVKWQ